MPGPRDSLVFVILLGSGCEPAVPPTSTSSTVAAVTTQPAPAPPTARAAAAIRAARDQLGTPYVWGGRGTRAHPGLDCLGLLYSAWGSVTGTSWTAYPVDPTKIVASHLLGDPVPGLAGVLRTELDSALLRPGDVLYFLLAGYEIPDQPLWVHDGVRYWPWHTGLYVGEADGLAIHASPSGGVMEQPLSEIGFDALFVTRP